MSAIIRSFVILIIAAGSVACGSAPEKRADPSPHGGAPAPELVQHDPGIYDLRTGEKVSDETFEAELAEATYVIVGESHPDAADHAVQDQVYRKLLELHGGPVALGLEMVSRPYQAPLDRYVASEITEETMLQQLEWEERWGFPSILYAPMWREAKSSGSPIVALNARRELTKAVARSGVDGISEAMQADLPDLDLGNDAHRTWMRRIFASHGMAMEESKFEKFYQAQVVWDETMAETAHAFMQTSEVPAMLILAGRGHTENDWGIPSRLRRRAGEGAKVVTISPMRTVGPALDELEGASDFAVISD